RWRHDRTTTPPPAPLHVSERPLRLPDHVRWRASSALRSPCSWSQLLDLHHARGGGVRPVHHTDDRSPAVDRDDVTRWLDAYFDAWQSNHPDDVASLFAPDATYAVSPFVKPWRGRDEIVRRWTAGTGTKLWHSYTVLATGDSLAVAHGAVAVRLPGGQVTELDGIPVLTFNDAGECVEHR